MPNSVISFKSTPFVPSYSSTGFMIPSRESPGKATETNPNESSFGDILQAAQEQSN
jgi:hypothetical protein